MVVSLVMVLPGPSVFQIEVHLLVKNKTITDSEALQNEK
ncbi:hypothetical protein PSE_1175 [Pseudovibrio sp. FO-BEG1]|nr:hypothetical protein PSE_1175 [Pseudovibrio sp. FO-BEG1]